MLPLLKKNPMRVGGAGLLAAIAVALLVGVFNADPSAPAQPQAPTQPDTPPAVATVAAAPAAATPAPTQAAGPVRPAALPLDAGVSPGAKEAIFNGGEGGASWAPVATLESREGSPLAALATTATREREGRGWDAGAMMRVQRAGLFRVETAGAHTLILSVTPGDDWHINRHATCRLAVGDPASVLMEQKGGGQAVGQATLAAGWHWLFQTCEVRHATATAEVSMTAPGANGPAALALYLPGEPVAPVPVPEG